ncbi:MAG: endonuclease MutS2 [Tenericutes bacterium]|nr:endonuclease MutS2 [Mycoplasmatota bacterium]
MLAELNKLEFHKILKEIRKYAVSDLAKIEVEKLEPLTNELEINRLLEETWQAKNMIIRYDQSPMTGVLNIRDAIRKAEIGSVLNVDEFLRIVSHQEAILRSQGYIRKIRQLEIESEHLDNYYDRLIAIPALKQKITTVIDKKGDIFDDASLKLSQIRKKINTTEERIDSKMASLLRGEASKLTDTLITIRNNRLVLPVKAEYKNSFKGVVHDTSSSGETYFIEPISCFNMNNELQGFRVQESAEIDRILRVLTEDVALESEALKNNLRIFTYLDIVFAKAKYAIEFDCFKPNLTKTKINLLNARHPLIDKKDVVGNNINFHNYHHILITGPNTGGKTVCLKTLGLLSIMAQSGILIPADEGSETMVFENIFADIGDEQSIEQSLSTFSSHISKIIYIIDNASPNSLILIDEIGSGTDPKEGASLAISIINHLRKKSVYSMITTHYSELKTYAFDLDDTVNASVEFDIVTLRPTYKLKVGIPGTSNAIQIAKRLGLHDDIIESAKEVSVSFDTDVSNLIKKLEKQSLDLDEEISQYKKASDTLKTKNDSLDKLYVEEKVKQNNLLKKLELEHLDRLKDREEEANSLIEQLNELRNNPGFKDHELAKLKHDVKSINQETNSYKKAKNTKIAVGDKVLVIPYQRQGIVNKLVSNKKYEVLMGTLSITLAEKDLEYVETPVAKKQKTTGSVLKTSETKVELDLRGQRYLEAIDELDKFVDSCLMNNFEFAYVIHGYGTGVLMKGVSEYIKTSSVIKSSRPGGQNEGGKGVTVIYFK